MPRNGSGIYTLPQPAFVAGTVISSAAVNSDLTDIATALTGSLPRDGQAGMSGQMKTVDGSDASPGYSFNNEDDTGFARNGAGSISVSILGTSIGVFTAAGWSGAVTGTGTLPIGLLCDFAGPTAPARWVLCFGQNVSRTTYAALFAVLGTTYGAGDGTTTFGLPDLRGRVTFAKDNMGGVAAGRLTSTYYGSDPTVLGNVGGTQSKTLVAANLPPYTPSGTIANGTITFPLVSVTSGATGASGAVTTGPNQAANTNLTSVLGAVQATSSFTGTPTSGTSTPLSAIDPGIIMNKIIYAGV